LSFGEILGLAAGLFSTGSLVPQVLRIYKLKSARDISYLFSIFFLAGNILWLSYGVHDHLMPLIFWNALSIIFIGLILLAKILYGKNPYTRRNKEIG
jgi:MtN3 and saliva related transmembrane protein